MWGPIARFRFQADEFCDVSEFKAVDCHTKYPVQLIRHTDIEEN